MDFFLQLMLTGLMVGAIYSLVAVGFVLIYKASGIFNLAQGELLMIAAYMCWAFLVQAHLPLWLGLLLTLGAAALLGLVIERLALRPMIGQPLFAIVMITIALSIILKGIVTGIWRGSQYYFPEFLAAAPMHLGGVILSQQHLYCFVAAILAVVALTFYFNRTKSGLAMRAVAEDHQVAQSTGVSVKMVFAMTWAIAAIVSAIGGILLGSINGVNFNLSVLGLKALPVVLLGGLDSILGAIIAGLAVGVLENVAAGYLDPLVGGGLQDVFPFIILLFVLLVKPYGLLGLRKIERV